MLDFSIQEDHNTGIQFILMAGVMNKLGVSNLIQAISDNQTQERPYQRLYDMRKVELDISIADFNEVLSLAWEKLHKPKSQHKAAMLAIDDFMLEILNIYRVQSRRYPFHIVEVFSDKHCAIRWLTQNDRD